MTTLIATDADVFVAGTTAAFCPQTVGAVAGSEWRPRFFMSYTCNNLSSFFDAGSGRWRARSPTMGPASA